MPCWPGGAGTVVSSEPRGRRARHGKPAHWRGRACAVVGWKILLGPWGSAANLRRRTPSCRCSRGAKFALPRPSMSKAVRLGNWSIDKS